jgi:hypothetical protein
MSQTPNSSASGSTQASQKAANKCGRSGCSFDVKNGMQCHDCHNWFHFKCTGLNPGQTDLLSNSSDPFVCISCLYRNAGAKHTVANTQTVDVSASVLGKQTVLQCNCASMILALNAKIASLSKELMAANARNEATWMRVENELNSLNEYLATSIPGPLAAKKVIQLSDSAIKDATKTLVDQRSRETRILLWGSFPKQQAPTDLAKEYLSSFLSETEQNTLYAEWLRSKKHRRSVGLIVSFPSATTVLGLLQDVVAIQETFPVIKAVTPDRSLDSRKSTKVISKDSPPEPLLEEELNDPKLRDTTRVALEPCLPRASKVGETSTSISRFATTPAESEEVDADEEDTHQRPFSEDEDDHDELASLMADEEDDRCTVVEYPISDSTALLTKHAIDSSLDVLRGSLEHGASEQSIDANPMASTTHSLKDVTIAEDSLQRAVHTHTRLTNPKKRRRINKLLSVFQAPYQPKKGILGDPVPMGKAKNVTKELSDDFRSGKKNSDIGKRRNPLEKDSKRHSQNVPTNNRPKNTQLSGSRLGIIKDQNFQREGRGPRPPEQHFKRHQLPRKLHKKGAPGHQNTPKICDAWARNPRPERPREQENQSLALLTTLSGLLHLLLPVPRLERQL